MSPPQKYSSGCREPYIREAHGGLAKYQRDFSGEGVPGWELPGGMELGSGAFHLETASRAKNLWFKESEGRAGMRSSARDAVGGHVRAPP